MVKVVKHAESVVFQSGLAIFVNISMVRWRLRSEPFHCALVGFMFSKGVFIVGIREE